MLKITNIESAPQVPFQLDGRIMLSKPTIEVIHLTLKPGEAIPKHVNQFDAAMFVLEGSGIIESGYESRPVREGTLVEIGSGFERGIQNTGEGNLKVLVMKIFS